MGGLAPDAGAPSLSSFSYIREYLGSSGSGFGSGLREERMWERTWERTWERSVMMSQTCGCVITQHVDRIRVAPS